MGRWLVCAVCPGTEVVLCWPLAHAFSPQLHSLLNIFSFLRERFHSQAGPSHFQPPPAYVSHSVPHLHIQKALHLMGSLACLSHGEKGREKTWLDPRERRREGGRDGPSRHILSDLSDSFGTYISANIYQCLLNSLHSTVFMRKI